MSRVQKVVFPYDRGGERSGIVRSSTIADLQCLDSGKG